MNASSKATSKKRKSNKSEIKALSKIVERESSDSSDSSPSSPHRLTRAISADSKVQQFNDCFAYSIGRILCKWIRNRNPTFFPNFDENDTRLSDAFPVYFFFEATEGSSVGEDLSVTLFIKTHNIPKSSYLNHCLFVLIYSVIVREFGCEASNTYNAFKYIIEHLNTKQSIHSLMENCPIYRDYCDICIDVLLHNVNSGMELFYFKFLNNDKNTIDEYNEIKNKPIHSQIFGMATRDVYYSINQMYANIKNVITQKKYNNYVSLLCNVVLFKAKKEYGLNTEISFSNLEDCFKRLDPNNNRENHMVTIVDYNYDDSNNRQLTIKNTWSILEPTMIIYEKELCNSIIINLDNSIVLLGIIRATIESDWVSIEESKTNKTRRIKIKRKASSSNKKGKKNKVSKIKDNVSSDSSESISPASPHRLTRAISTDSKVQRFNDCFAYSIGRILCKWIRVHNSKFFPNFDENDTRLSDAFPVERFYESTTKTSLGETPDIISFIEENGITKSVYLNHCLFILFYSVIVREVGCDNAIIGVAFMYIIEQIKTEQSVRMLMQNCPIYKDYCDICLDVLLHNVKSGINSVIAIEPINNIYTIINTIPIKVTPTSSSSVVASDKTYVNSQIRDYTTDYYYWKKDPENDNEPTYTGYSWKDKYINLFNRYVNLFFEHIKQNINIFHNYLSLTCNTALFNAKRSLGQETELSIKDIIKYAQLADDANPSKLNEYNHTVTIVGYNYDNPKNRQIIIKNTWSKDNPIMIIYEGELFNPIMFRNSNYVALYYIAQRDTRETDWVSDDEITLKHTKTKKIKRKKIRQSQAKGNGKSKRKGPGKKGTKKGTKKRTKKGTKKRKSSN